MSRPIERPLAILVLAALTSLPATAERPAPRVLAFEAVVQGQGDAELRWPVAVAAASALELAVADAWGGRLVIFAANDSGWSTGRAISLGTAPLAVVHDGRRYVVALRGRRDLATVESSASEPDSLSLPPGTVPGALAAAPGGGLWVYDAAGGRVLALDAAGSIGEETALPAGVTGLATATGGFWAVFAGESRLRRYVGGRIADEWTVPGQGPVPAWPDGIAVEPGGLLFADRHGCRIVALDGAGRLTGAGGAKGWEPGRLLSPAGMTRLPDGRLAVADRGNGRVQIFQRLDVGSSP